LIPDVERRRQLGLAGRAFVERVHDADRVAEQLVEHYRAPRRPVRDRAMPDWMSMKPARQIETLEARIEALEVDLARARRTEQQLRERLGLPSEETPSIARRVTRRVVPMRIRRRLTRRG
jgi:hypothetical protein